MQTKCEYYENGKCVATKEKDCCKCKGLTQKCDFFDDIRKKPIHDDAVYYCNKSSENDVVNHPSHYCDGGIETIDFIEAKKLDYYTGNAVKYISRAGKKDKSKEIEDLQKAVWHLNRKINKLSNSKE